MSISIIYEKQVSLLLDVLPIVSKENMFAVKGGTAINLFVRDMPRLSVDIDLTYLPVAPREETLKEISAALERIANNISHILPNTTAVKIYNVKNKRLNKLLIKSQGVQIKIEPNEILRGTVFPISKRRLCESAKQYFKRDVVNLALLSFADLYAGKLCAALDRQHPRDLFDVKLLLENEGLTDEIRQAFVVYLACHSRPMHELLNPNFSDINTVFEKEFNGMSLIETDVGMLENASKKLVLLINRTMTGNERHFLLSIKQGEPNWELLPGLDIKNLPALQWKIINIYKIEKKKRKTLEEKLIKVLQL